MGLIPADDARFRVLAGDRNSCILPLERCIHRRQWFLSSPYANRAFVRPHAGSILPMFAPHHQLKQSRCLRFAEQVGFRAGFLFALDPGPRDTAVPPRG